MSKRKPSWENYKDKVAKKRSRNEKGAAAAGMDVITVQRLSSNVEGKCQKYSRIGPLTLVPLEEEATLENIKKACKSHFNTEFECDVLAGERGPSFTDEKQIQNWKVLHIRFIEGIPSSTTSAKRASHASEPVELKESPKKVAEGFSRPVKSSVIPSAPVKSSVIPSVSLSQMLRLGKLIVPDSDVATLRLEEFSIEQMQWLEPFEVTISLERKAFSEGAFREAYLAKSLKGLPKGQYVLKKYKKTEVKGIESLFNSIEAHTRKSVQLNALARNMAQNLTMEAPVFEFGKSFSYHKVYFSSLNDEFVTLETFLEGTFTKYINNTGSICMQTKEELSLKAETFVHFTYLRSNKQLMVTDIQGVGYCLCDPEIASTQQVDVEDESIFFCTGNLSTAAINTFKSEHQCNTYCNLLKLEKFPE